MIVWIVFFMNMFFISFKNTEIRTAAKVFNRSFIIDSSKVLVKDCQKSGSEKSFTKFPIPTQ